MSVFIDLDYELSAPAPGFKPGQSSASTLSPCAIRTLQPVGPAFLAHKRRHLNQFSFAEDDKIIQDSLAAAAAAAATNGDDDLGVGEEDESDELLARDPKEWKTQDHYAVLGLSSLRWKATQDQIKIAHRKKVLKHHPDKKAGSSGLTSDDSFFKCIAKAHEILSNPEKRRHFDSVDESIDDFDVPTGKESAEKFYTLWDPVFQRESRFSEPKNGAVPQLGDANSTRQHVDEFYDFWYNFDSWRSFEYLDKEINEGSDNRDDKRYTEKKNRNERASRKKEDNARLRNLVDKALSIDPRIKQFKADDKAAREAKKNKGRNKGTSVGGGGGVVDPRKVAEDQKKAEEQAKKQVEEQAKVAEQEKLAKADAKKAKEAAKKAIKKEKKALNKLIIDNNYFQSSTTLPTPAIIENQLNELDALCEKLELTKLGEFRKNAEAAEGVDLVKAQFVKVASEVGIQNSAFV
ncbi:probable ZUO1 - zuotin [Melanopsichium pennsylvanicum]|uniref:Probable ZUO1 - zuotin n=2 Tax=Melanopsichium pennsylvanicum TaxID=63383 RepID=A0AAJ4XIA4_9BASI|nr:probable ZUO1-zuotin [Melanopsichium pennsylvanicum 4]SNX82226.1 probable ZUO1 - zuotin [Melanopsichium pennsylvanicum]